MAKADAIASRRLCSYLVFSDRRLSGSIYESLSTDSLASRHFPVTRKTAWAAFSDRAFELLNEASLRSRVLTIHSSISGSHNPLRTDRCLFERMTHGWWQRLGSNCLRVMEAATEAKR